jgi:hypothetical protein
MDALMLLDDREVVLVSDTTAGILAKEAEGEPFIDIDARQALAKATGADSS